MTTKNFFICQGIVSLAFGIPLLFASQMMVDMYAVQKTEVTGLLDLVARGYGALLIAVGVTYILIRDASPSIARRGFLQLPILGNTLATIVHVRAMLQGTENSMGWTTVLIIAALGVWSALLLSKEKDLNLQGGIQEIKYP